MDYPARWKYDNRMKAEKGTKADSPVPAGSRPNHIYTFSTIIKGILQEESYGK